MHAHQAGKSGTFAGDGPFHQSTFFIGITRGITQALSPLMLKPICLWSRWCQLGGSEQEGYALEHGFGSVWSEGGEAEKGCDGETGAGLCFRRGEGDFAFRFLEKGDERFDESCFKKVADRGTDIFADGRLGVREVVGCAEAGISRQGPEIPQVCFWVGGTPPKVPIHRIFNCGEDSFGEERLLIWEIPVDAPFGETGSEGNIFHSGTEESLNVEFRQCGG